MRRPRLRRGAGHRPGPAGPIAAALAVLTLAGCGGPRALTQAEVAETLVGPDDAALRGWMAGTTNEVAPEGDDTGPAQLLAQASGISDACRQALTAFGGGVGKPSAYASRAFTQGDRELDVTVRGYDQDPPALPDARAAVASCPSFTLTVQGQQLSGRLRAPAYDVTDAAALGLDLTGGSEHTALDLMRVRRGANLISVSVSGADEAADHDLLAGVARAQADKVTAAAG